MVHVRIAALAFVLCACMALPVPAQEEEDAQESRAQPDEIVITGARNVHQLRSLMMSAEKKAYEIFNGFNDERRFNISCRAHQPTGTRLERQICQPQFELEATAAHGRAYWENYRDHLDPYHPGDSSPAPQPPVEAVIARQRPEFQRKMREIAEAHPEFLEALIEYARIREAYESAATRGGNRN